MSTATSPSIEAVQAELAALEDPKVREANERRGDDHGINLSKLRGVAKSAKLPIAERHEFAKDLWATGDTATRLVALLLAAPKRFEADELDAMLRQARAPKVLDWFVNYMAKKSPHLEALRTQWMADADPVVESAGWDLTAVQVYDRPEVLGPDGLDELLDTIESRMAGTEGRLMWSMNNVLAAIGIEHPEHRDRAVAIGERLEVLKDYPVAPNCTSPFAPIWIAEIVARNEAAAARR